MVLDVKICGLKTAETVDAALVGGATHIGFNFFEKSPRFVSPEEAGQLRKAALGKALAVAVTVDADDAALEKIVEELKPDMLQLHGKETPVRVDAVRNAYGLPVIKALSISQPEDLYQIDGYRSVASGFLFDARKPANSELPGGNGIAFDWSILADVDPTIDYFLAGGINAGNVGDAVRLARPRGVDTASGVESSPGVKDIELIRNFFAALRRAKAIA